MLAAGAVVFFRLGGFPGGAEASGGVRVQQAASAPAADISTALWFGTEGRGKGGPTGVSWLILLALNHATERAAVVYLPAGTAVEIPGRGLLAVGDAFVSGGAPLLLMSAENLLGLSLDDHIAIGARRARALFTSLGPLQVDVPGEVRRAGGAGQPLFSPGPQKLGARWLTNLLFSAGAGDDIELGPRHLAVWKSMFGRLRAPGKQVLTTSSLERAVPGGFAPRQSRLLRSIAAVERDDLTLASAPVSQLSTGGDELYSLHSEASTELLERALGAPELQDEEVQVQILNGNGVPGVGAKVAERLVGKGYRIALSGNASRLDYRRTLIVTYDRSLRGQRSATRARRLLGTGEVQVAAQPQGIVDLTIVVGKDFSQR
ncbi:MAG: LytR C-terminal domain-containing protein [Actinomycetota bacterium]|nr:LytR C-terminal domain-containing protein [Actinomycetota bacterium]